LNILIPMSGNGQRFVDAGFSEPKPFIDVLGKPMIQRVVENLGVKPHQGRFIFVVRDAVAMNRIREIMVGHDYEVVIAGGTTAGAACTALLAREFIANNDPLLIANSDQIVDGIELPADDVLVNGVIWTFEAHHPKWSFVASDDKQRVWAVVEKQVVSRRATCGIYWWKRGNDFVRAAEQMIEKNVRVNNEFYLAPTYNEAIMRGARITEAYAKTMWGLGDPESLNAYLTRPGR
jgi:dTDP-glucose pyrophosphorylase